MKRDILFLVLQFLLLTLYVADPFYMAIAIPSWLLFIAIPFLVGGVVVILFGVLNLNDALDQEYQSAKFTGTFFRGIYKYIRHPIYAGMLLVLMSIAWSTGSWFKAAVTIVLGVIFYFKSSLEEKKLVKEYFQYETYKERTGRFFPKFRNSRSR